ncbi:hypothetical protein [Candidatus Mycolicibacterium alkanivorans]|uniref:Uncharacterized protein n=1 Tax=Candidatus Mycolicibacterium alkanivorans TaxID=2954114 RepID=A0ABS9YUJ9_9MYCO|nr:hypothetical protein [Candidatus Mycolicibacterium alkanivorans]MCI4674798.1 hypothetical protein [Candidatus Mycolicibacterium alkanivorans]
MVFAVKASTGPVITDPESGRDLGRLSREKLRVRVFDTQPLFARAHTFVITDDFYGLLQIPFLAGSLEDVVSVDIGDAIELVRRGPTTRQAIGQSYAASDTPSAPTAARRRRVHPARRRLVRAVLEVSMREFGIRGLDAGALTDVRLLGLDEPSHGR